MILSILIPSLYSRHEVLSDLMSVLLNQLSAIQPYNTHCLTSTTLPGGILRYYNESVEIIIFSDNKEYTTGAKRNILLGMANADYVVSIDDDDMVPVYYLKNMVHACQQGADCIAINGIMTTDGKAEIKWRLSKDYDNVTIREGGENIYLRKTNHITAVKREHALKAMFPNKSNAEDKAYSDAVNKYLKTEFTIYEPMYHYRYKSTNKEY